jgi:benzil reductase ((S)-benzoin forming)
MTQHLTILTGASRGMGLAMAEQLLDAGHDLLCISRHHHDALGARATRTGQRCEQWARDLSQADTVAVKLEGWLAAQRSHEFASVTLINNAGLLPRIAPLDAIPAADIAAAMRVDLEAPMILASAFLRATRQWAGLRKVLNISSGLGRRAMASQAP